MAQQLRKDVEAKHSLVVGGTRGMGRVLVRAFAKEGHIVSVIGRRAPSESDNQMPMVRYWEVDVSHDGRLRQVLSEVISQQGKINNLVFFQRYRGDGDDWAGEIETTLTGTKNVIEFLTPAFRETGGKSIVMVSSPAAEFIADEQPLSYHVAKAGLNQMVRFYALTLGRQRVRVNSISPGTVLKEEAS